jgi:hypothetical protein
VGTPTAERTSTGPSAPAGASRCPSRRAHPRWRPRAALRRDWHSLVACGVDRRGGDAPRTPPGTGRPEVRPPVVEPSRPEATADRPAVVAALPCRAPRRLSCRPCRHRDPRLARTAAPCPPSTPGARAAPPLDGSRRDRRAPVRGRRGERPVPLSGQSARSAGGRRRPGGQPSGS